MVLPLARPGNAHLSLPSGKYLDLDRFRKFITGTIRTVPAIDCGSNSPPGSVNFEDNKLVQALGPVNSSPCVAPIIVMTGPGLTP